MAEEKRSPEEVNAETFAVLEQIVDRGRSEPAWKEKLMSDPGAAFEEAGWDVSEFDPATADVVGQTAVELPIFIAWIPVLINR